MQKEDAPLAGMRAQGILKPLMLRRTKGSTLVRTLSNHTSSLAADCLSCNAI
jgi:hypothetical protein